MKQRPGEGALSVRCGQAGARKGAWSGDHLVAPPTEGGSEAVWGPVGVARLREVL